MKSVGIARNYIITDDGASYLFESSWKKPYTDRGIRNVLAKYVAKAGIERKISPHRLRHFLLVWLKKLGVEDSHIQAYSGKLTRQSLGVYSEVSVEGIPKKNTIGLSENFRFNRFDKYRIWFCVRT